MAGLGAAKLLAEHREDWTGTYIALFQPGEEIAAGARSMIEDGLTEKVPVPDVCLGQHVLTNPAAGKVAVAPGPVLSSSVSMRVTVHGSGSHGSMPHLGVDPVVLAAAIVTRIQTLVAREIAPGDFGVVTVGALHAGTSANIIPDRAELALNFRAYSDQILDHLVEGVQRIVRAECEAAAPPSRPSSSSSTAIPSPTTTPGSPSGCGRHSWASSEWTGSSTWTRPPPPKTSPGSPTPSGSPTATGAPAPTPRDAKPPRTTPHSGPRISSRTLRIATEAAASAAFALLARRG